MLRTPPPSPEPRMDLIAHLRDRIKREGAAKVANPAVMRETARLFLARADAALVVDAADAADNDDNCV